MLLTYFRLFYTLPQSMKNRNLFLLLVIVVLVVPGIHFFIAGNNAETSSLRNVLVGVQVLVGFALLFLFRKPEEKK